MYRRKQLRERLNRISLRTQLTLLIAISFSIIIILIISYNYKSNIKAISDQHTETTKTFLNLEMKNFEAYLSEISRFSLLLRYNESFMQMIKKGHTLTYLEESELHHLIQYQFNSRKDLLSFRLFLVNQSLNLEIDSNLHKVRPFSFSDLTKLPDYDIFTKGKYYSSYLPSGSPSSLMVFYRTIINIEDQQPLAIVELTLDNSYFEDFIKNYGREKELFLMLDSQNRVFYRNNREQITEEFQNELFRLLPEQEGFSITEAVQNVTYHIVGVKSPVNGSILISCMPASEIDRQLTATRNISLLLAFASIFTAVLLTCIFIRLVTRPLAVLSGHFKSLGSGNFTTTAEISGSSEIHNLSDSFNSMVHQIDDLIQKNYVSRINEKTARLIALEAQLNPHFLYNTLQAISTEAVINHQQKIYHMITSLASMLRYSIKEGDFVMLEQEVKYVSDYLTLQKARFEDRLDYEFHISKETKKLYIPKISIQTLAENSIAHGMEGEITSIFLHIDAFLKDNLLYIIVSDNGNGITKEKLEELEHQFSALQISGDRTIGIGLLNLYSRLNLLYSPAAALEIKSTPQKGTAITLKIPIYQEAPHV